ncbi:vacuolar protein sorting-associated protein 37C-like [Pseudorasbora parva]|uniref:vacuolar protein sorting-associated protein 37C-like n=1 Tax=Pseudorasbora parva TaxID=51549 RepID=UPI00351E222D
MKLIEDVSHGREQKNKPHKASFTLPFTAKSFLWLLNLNLRTRRLPRQCEVVVMPESPAAMETIPRTHRRKRRRRRRSPGILSPENIPEVAAILNAPPRPLARPSPLRLLVLPSPPRLLALPSPPRLLALPSPPRLLALPSLPRCLALPWSAKEQPPERTPIPITGPEATLWAPERPALPWSPERPAPPWLLKRPGLPMLHGPGPPTLHGPGPSSHTPRHRSAHVPWPRSTYRPRPIYVKQGPRSCSAPWAWPPIPPPGLPSFHRPS